MSIVIWNGKTLASDRRQISFLQPPKPSRVTDGKIITDFERRFLYQGSRVIAIASVGHVLYGKAMRKCLVMERPIEESLLKLSYSDKEKYGTSSTTMLVITHDSAWVLRWKCKPENSWLEVKELPPLAENEIFAMGSGKSTAYALASIFQTTDPLVLVAATSLHEATCGDGVVAVDRLNKKRFSAKRVIEKFPKLTLLNCLKVCMDSHVRQVEIINRSFN